MSIYSFCKEMEAYNPNASSNDKKQSSELFDKISNVSFNPGTKSK